MKDKVNAIETTFSVHKEWARHVKDQEARHKKMVDRKNVYLNNTAPMIRQKLKFAEDI